MSVAEFDAHLAQGVTNVCRCWSIARRDGFRLGFTDHDNDLVFEGVVFKANAGMTAKALMQSTGLAVDNSEAVGALSHAAIREQDIAAGRYDGAEVVAWLVNWADAAERVVQFRGEIGEIGQSAGAFTAELRGLTEGLNQPQGRVFQKLCSAVLGDGQCRVDTTQPEFMADVIVAQIDGDRTVRFAQLPDKAEGWFTRGVIRVLTGPAAGLTGTIKADRTWGSLRELELWQGLRIAPEPSDMVRLIAGCDRRAETCREKFGNYLNFRGFPHVPGEDWLMSYPSRSGSNTGGSLNGGGS